MNSKEYVNRSELWSIVNEALNSVENHLNKEGNTDLEKEDYIRINQLETRLQAIKDTYT